MISFIPICLLFFATVIVAEIFQTRGLEQFSRVANHKSSDKYLSIRGGDSAYVKKIDQKSILDGLIADPANKGKLFVIDFTAKWCGPCKMIAPLFDEMSEEFSDSCIFVKVDVDEAPEISAAHNVMSMPTFLFIKNGKVVDRFSGASVEKLRQVIFSKIE